MNFAEFWDTWCDQQSNTGNAQDPQASAKAGWDAGQREVIAAFRRCMCVAAQSLALPERKDVQDNSKNADGKEAKI